MMMRVLLRVVVPVTFGVALSVSAACAQSAARQPAPSRPSLGVAVDTVTLVVRAVQPGSSATTAGLLLGDRLTMIDGQPATYGRFTAAMSRLSAADTIVLRVRRQDATLTLKLGPNPSAETYLSAACEALDATPPGAPRGGMVIAVRRGCQSREPGRTGALPSGSTVYRSGDPHMRIALNIAGMYVLELSPALADYFDVASGLLVTEVTARTAAARAGVRAGDVIVAVNSSAVKGMVDIMRARDGGAVMTLGVRRSGRVLTLKMGS